jgi:hypothetical protein
MLGFARNSINYSHFQIHLTMSEEIMVFTLDGEIIDIEWCFQHGHIAPRGRKYRYKVDDKYYVTHYHEISGKEILEKAGKDPKEYILREKVHGGYKTIEPDDIVDLTRHGLEKFKTIKNEHTDGETAEKSLRRDFSLLEEDEEYLNSLGLDWEALKSGNSQWIVVYGYPIPSGYNFNNVTVAVLIAANYPTAQLDMLYYFPALARKDGVSIPNLSEYMLDGKKFQAWSRHRTGQNSWRVGIDCLATHIPLTDLWLKNEFTKRPTNALRT